LAGLCACVALATGGAAQDSEPSPPPARDDASVELLVCAPGFPGTPEQAKATMDALAVAITRGAGWPEGRVRARYVTAEAEGVSALKTRRPALLLATLPFYCKHHALVRGELVAASLLAGKATEAFRIVAPPAFPGEGLAALRGRRLTGTRLEDPDFLTRLVFAGTLDARRDLTLVDGKRTLRALKLAGDAAADALLLSDEERRLLQTPELKPRLEGWRTLFESEPLPSAPVVALGTAPAATPDATLVAAVRRALLALHGSDEGRKLCERLRVTGFGPADPTAYAAAVKRYHPPADGEGGEGRERGDD
jgi:hypothetical protein